MHLDVEIEFEFAKARAVGHRLALASGTHASHFQYNSFELSTHEHSLETIHNFNYNIYHTTLHLTASSTTHQTWHRQRQPNNHPPTSHLHDNP